MQATGANWPEFTMKLRDLKNWNRLCQDDLTHNNISRASSSPHLRAFQERLRRKRYIDDAIEDVRAVLAHCGLPDLRLSRYVRRSRGLGSLQRLRAYISRASSQRRLTYRNWTT
jgi:hypothetical protein